MSMLDKATLPAGRKLDALIAERVMGWQTIQYEEWPGSFVPMLWWPEGPSPQGRDLDRLEDGRWAPWGLPAYSTDLAAAMAVWQHLRDSGRWCCLDIGSDYNFCWTLKLTPAPPVPEPEGWKHEPAVIVDGEESLPLAICCVALMAITKD